MITWKKIKIAINNRLKQKFNIPINSNDISEGFDKPSFFVEFDEMRQEGLLTQIEKSAIVRIYYFPKSEDSASIEILDMMEQLGNAFDMKLPVEDRLLNIIEPRFIESDKVLQFEFDISFEDARENEYGTENHNTEVMQELDMDLKKG